MGLNKRQEQIADGLRSLIPLSDEIYSGVVKSVNEANATMEVYPDPDNTDFVLPVMLRSVVDGLKGIVLIPTVGSEVTYAAIEGAGRYTLVNAAQLDKVLIDVPMIQVSCNEVVIKGAKKAVIETPDLALKSKKVVVDEGTNGGVPVAAKVKANDDAIKTYLNGFVAAVAAALTTIDGTAGSVSVATFNTTMSALQLSFVNIENPNLKH